MRSIILTQGKVATIDDEFYELVIKHKWFARFNTSNKAYYATREVDRKHINMHNLMLPPSDGYVVDHINGDTLDNRKDNLRYATVAQNAQNQKIAKDNKSGYKGVYLHKATGRYNAQITINKKQMSLGYFKDPIEAAKAYDKAAITHFGEFARPNFPVE